MRQQAKSTPILRNSHMYGASALRIYGCHVKLPQLQTYEPDRLACLFHRKSCHIRSALLRPSFPNSLPTSQIRKMSCGRTINCMVLLAPLLASTKCVKSSANLRFRAAVPICMSFGDSPFTTWNLHLHFSHMWRQKSAHTGLLRPLSVSPSFLSGIFMGSEGGEGQCISPR
jgi:hypothetical protein